MRFQMYCWQESLSSKIGRLFCCLKCNKKATTHIWAIDFKNFLKNFVNYFEPPYLFTKLNFQKFFPGLKFYQVFSRCPLFDRSWTKLFRMVRLGWSWMFAPGIVIRLVSLQFSHNLFCNGSDGSPGFADFATLPEDRDRLQTFIFLFLFYSWFFIFWSSAKIIFPFI